jgi:hypothetical protein
MDQRRPFIQRTRLEGREFAGETAVAYDLIAGNGRTFRHNPVVVGSITFDEIKTVMALRKRSDTAFLAAISAYMSDAEFTPEDILQAQTELLDLLPLELPAPERALLHKLIAVLSYASEKKLRLFGVSD